MAGPLIDLHPPGDATKGARKPAMWNHAEVAGLLDDEGRVCLISRNEHEAPVRHVIGKRVLDLLHGESHDKFEAAFRNALNGKETHALLSGHADSGELLYGRVRFQPTSVPGAPVMFHMRRLPKTWQRLSPREREVVHSLHAAGMNPKRAASELGMSIHTLNAHRRSICQKCGLRGVGEFWVFVERCR